MTAPAAAPYVPPGSVEISGHTYVRDAAGGLIPIERVKPQDLLRDQLVHDIFEAAVALSQKLAEFKAKAHADVQAHQDLVDQNYGAKARPGGDKGNVSLKSIDGLKQVQIQVSDVQSFESAPIRAAKTLIDECLAEWSADANAELRAVVVNAFKVDKKGELSKSALFGLLRWEIQDPRWLRAMEAIRDSITVDGTKTYVRVHHRPTPESRFDGVSLDLATAWSVLDAGDLDEAIANAANPGGIRTGQLQTSSPGAERRIRQTMKRVLSELPSEVSVGELLEALD